jgi:Sigma-70, region 4
LRTRSGSPRCTGALEKLSRADRDVLALCVWAGLEYTAAAEALGVPVGTVCRCGSSDPAFAVEKNSDGTLTVTSKDFTQLKSLGYNDMAAEIKKAGFNATVEKFPAGMRCEPSASRGKPLKQRTFRDHKGQLQFSYTMTHHDVFLAEDFERAKVGNGKHGPIHLAQAYTYAFIEGKALPCHRVNLLDWQKEHAKPVPAPHGK